MFYFFTEQLCFKTLIFNFITFDLNFSQFDVFKQNEDDNVPLDKLQDTNISYYEYNDLFEWGMNLRR